MRPIARNETTSDSIASLAARIMGMDDGEIRGLAFRDDIPGMIRSVAASVLTQATSD